ncbi:MAG: FAD-dependent oxidoreductase [Alphaproteobacteria bacterium]|nr:FAD-dependent oxidoreductase [Alphaproteobacteria bacterium]
MIDRRDVLRALLASAAVGVPFARADGPRVLPAPDFDRLRPFEPYVVGVRPFRKRGVRLEEGGRLGTKRVFHNYGHAGAGITLSFGCAEEVADLVDPLVRDVPDGAVAVLGTGVVGLTTAAALRRRHPRLPVTVYAKDLDLKRTTSHVAGGQFEPSGVWGQMKEGDARVRLESWLRRAKARIRELEPHWDRYGIVERDNYALSDGVAGFDDGTPTDVIAPSDALDLPFDALRAPGRRYRTWLLNPLYLLPALRADLEKSGVAFQQRMFETPDDVAKLPEPVVVNCTGYGARALFGDQAVIAQRGHLVLLERPTEAHDWFFGGGCANGVTCYVFCRHDDIVVGGTVIGADDRDLVLPEDQAVFDRIVTNARNVFAGFPARCETG